MGQLKKLLYLDLDGNRFTSLPDFLGRLTELRTLDVRKNSLTSVPASIARLEHLETFHLEGNPLSPPLESAYNSGIDELRSYLLSIENPEEGEELYEAKLLFVGEGGVGKTTLLKAMKGEEPATEEPTTHGINIDVESLRVPHPDKEGIQIRLNAWDFGGQDVYRVTHQFFFSQRSIFLVLWRPRYGVGQSRVHDWLKTIELRVGRGARVIIVSTHSRSDQRIPRIDRDALREEFKGLFLNFHEVDSMVDDQSTGEKLGVAELKQKIAETAKDLEQMGMRLNRSWLQARDQLITLKKPYIEYSVFSAICREGHGLDEIATKTLAILMHDLGYILYFSEDESLKDGVVLQPDWLAKAIGFVLEDRTTNKFKGILRYDRLKEIWQEHEFAHEPHYDPVYYPFFLRLMEKFDVSYRLQDESACLVAEHVPYDRPSLPWLPDEPLDEGQRRIAMVCVMEEDPPGIVPWMIARTHRYVYERIVADGSIERLYWQRGMFLRNGRHGEASLELREKEFRIYVTAAWPEYFMNVLERILTKLIADNWPGLRDHYYFAALCPGTIGDEPCPGRFNIEALREFLEEGDTTQRCMDCRMSHDIVDLLFGFQREDTREQLGRIESKLDVGLGRLLGEIQSLDPREQLGRIEREIYVGFADVHEEFELLEGRIADIVATIMHAIASESKNGPRLFTLEPADGNWAQMLQRLVSERYVVQLWCEAEGEQHPVLEEGKGRYEFSQTREWVARSAPYINLAVGILRTVAPMALPAAKIILGDEELNERGIAAQLELSKEASGALLQHGIVRESKASPQGDGLLSGEERSGLLTLQSLLREIDPTHRDLGLTRVPSYTGEFVWLCRSHYELSQPPVRLD